MVFYEGEPKCPFPEGGSLRRLWRPHRGRGGKILDKFLFVCVQMSVGKCQS